VLIEPPHTPHGRLHSTYTGEKSKSIPNVAWRGGRDLTPPSSAGEDRTAPDSDGQHAENRGVAALENGRGRTGVDSECQSVSEGISVLVTQAVGALDRGDIVEVRAVLKALAALVARARYASHLRPPIWLPIEATIP
jgi:hypothetical protein